MLKLCFFFHVKINRKYHLYIVTLKDGVRYLQFLRMQKFLNAGTRKLVYLKTETSNKCQSFKEVLFIFNKYFIAVWPSVSKFGSWVIVPRWWLTSSVFRVDWPVDWEWASGHSTTLYYSLHIATRSGYQGKYLAGNFNFIGTSVLNVITNFNWIG